MISLTHPRHCSTCCHSGLWVTDVLLHLLVRHNLWIVAILNVDKPIYKKLHVTQMVVSLVYNAWCRGFVHVSEERFGEEKINFTYRDPNPGSSIPYVSHYIDCAVPILNFPLWQTISDRGSCSKSWSECSPGTPAYVASNSWSRSRHGAFLKSKNAKYGHKLQRLTVWLWCQQQDTWIMQLLGLSFKERRT
jgi:hypothetical protein